MHKHLLTLAACALIAQSAFAAEGTEEDRERFYAQLPRIKAIQERFEAQYMTDERMVSVGISLEKDNRTPIFYVVVADSAMLKMLPEKFEGIGLKTQVGKPLELMDGGPTCNGGAGPPCHRNQLPLPVEMGNSGAWFLGTACTMGFKACDLGSLTSQIVTNSHCAQYKNGCALAAINDPFKHVGPMDAMPPGSNVNIGTISGHAAPVCQTQANNYTDATKVTSAFFQSSKNQRDIGAPKSTPGSNPLPGWNVQYSGRTTGYNRGPIVAVNVTVNVPATGGFCCGALTMKDQISFDPTHSIAGGDSGSGVLIHRPGVPAWDNRVAGLLFGSDGVLGYANNIDRVLSALNLTLDFTQCGLPN